MPSIHSSAVNMVYKNKSVQICLIDQKDLTYQISTSKPVDCISQSISQIGLINPPILSPVGNSGYRIVSGFRRIAACKKLGWSELSARILPSDMEQINILGLAIADNVQHRELNLIEQAVAIEKLGLYLDDDTDIISYGKKIGLQLNRQFINRLRRLNKLSDSIKDRVISDTIPLTIALELDKLDAAAAEAVALFFDELRPTLNQQKEILLLVKELARVEDRSISDLIKTGSIGAIRGDMDLDRSQKLKRIRALLKKRRYPAIHHFEALFDRNLKALELPRDIDFSPPANFEGNRFSMTIFFHSLAEFKTHVGTLIRLADDPHFIEILKKQIDNQETLY